MTWLLHVNRVNFLPTPTPPPPLGDSICPMGNYPSLEHNVMCTRLLWLQKMRRGTALYEVRRQTEETVCTTATVWIICMVRSEAEEIGARLECNTT